MSTPLAVVIMAAGKGTRMKNPDVAKVMYTINDRPMIDYVVDLALAMHALRTVAIVGWQKESLVTHLAAEYQGVQWAEQSPQLGTGHAVMQAEKPLDGFEGDVLVLSGDVPLLLRATVQSLVDRHGRERAAATVLTAMLDDATGYGRILRDADGRVERIVEQKDATEEQLSIREINTGIYVFAKDALFAGLRHITPNNAQNEYYLTDVFQYLWRNKLPVHAVVAGDPREVQGINTVQQLDEARAALGRAPG
jgi:UDP-N-acetylglucosamine pyrophosphorylase